MGYTQRRARGWGRAAEGVGAQRGTVCDTLTIHRHPTTLARARRSPRSDGTVVTSPRRIAARYLRGWFWLDLVACLPIDYMTGARGAATSANELSRLARLPRVMRLLRLVRMAKLARVSSLSRSLRFIKVRAAQGRGRPMGVSGRAEKLGLTHAPTSDPRPPSLQSDVHPAFVRLFTSLFWSALALHILAGAWFMLARDAEPGTETWLSRIHMTDAPVESQYLVSVYFMLSTFTQLGIGDVTPRCVCARRAVAAAAAALGYAVPHPRPFVPSHPTPTPHTTRTHACSTDGERLFTIVCLLVGIVWVATVISDVTAVMGEYDRSNNEAKERKRELQAFFIRAKLPRSLKQRIFK
jgi:hypothetical protein